MTLAEVVKFLKEHDNYRIVCHSNPDGDTIGSAFALAVALRRLGKSANICCSDIFGKQYEYITAETENDENADFDTLVAVDIADKPLFGKKFSELSNNVDLLIDHHASNSRYAENCYVNSTAPANCEIMFKIISRLGVQIDKYIADCLFTGLTTDTGCFRYSSVTAQTHNVAAKLISAGADHAKINQIMFETKSLERIKLEKYVLNSLELFYDNRVAVVFLTQDMLKKTGAKEDELEGVASIPRQIEGVLVGVLLREKPDGTIRVSVRTNEPIDASVLCREFGGGGHKRAAGCVFECDINTAKDRFLVEVGKCF